MNKRANYGGAGVNYEKRYYALLRAAYKYYYSSDVEHDYSCPQFKSVLAGCNCGSRQAERELSEFFDGHQPCGHPISAIVSSGEGTSYCRMCEEEE